MTVTFHATQGIHPEPSSLHPFTFPGGERHLKGTPAEGEHQRFAVIRGADANDYITAALWAQKLRSLGEPVTIFVPYLPAARSDHDVPSGAQAYAALINAIGADHVVVFDPHSPVMPALIHNVVVVGSAELVRSAVAGAEVPYTGVIAPDKGAHARADAAAAALGLPVYTAGKTRNQETGALDGFYCDPLPEGGRYLVVDDICDGGGTFRGLASVLGLPPEQLGLYVSHGVFSGKAAGLSESFGEIFTTDSHPGSDNPAIKARVIGLMPHLIGFVPSTPTSIGR